MSSGDFLSIRDFSPQQIQRFLDLGLRVKATPAAYSHSLSGKTLAMIFEKPSLRTRVTFDVGIQQLGGFSVYLSPAEINLGRSEEHTSELQSQFHLVCRLLLEKKKKKKKKKQQKNQEHTLKHTLDI